MTINLCLSGECSTRTTLQDFKRSMRQTYLQEVMRVLRVSIWCKHIEQYSWNHSSCTEKQQSAKDFLCLGAFFDDERFENKSFLIVRSVKRIFQFLKNDSPQASQWSIITDVENRGERKETKKCNASTAQNINETYSQGSSGTTSHKPCLSITLIGKTQKEESKKFGNRLLV